MDAWLIQLLANESPDCRLATQHIISILVPHDVFQEVPDFPNAPNLPTAICFSVRDVDQEMLDTAAAVLKFLMDNVASVLTQMRELDATGRIAKDFILIVSLLADITDLDVGEFFVQLLQSVLAMGSPLNSTVKPLLRCLVDKKSPLITTDLILACLPFDADPSDRDMFQRLQGFYTILSDLIDRFEPPLFFVEWFLKSAAFPRVRFVMNEFFGDLAIFIRHLAARYPDEYREFINNDLERIGEQNYSALIVALEALGDRLPILRFLPHACESHQYFPLSELVVKSFTCNEGEVPGVLPFIKILNCPQLIGEARDLIWALVHNQPPSLDDFSARFSWMGDWVEQTRYLLGLPPSEAVAGRLLECSQNSMESFHYAYEWLRENGAASLVDPFFVAVMLKREIIDFWETVADYVSFLAEGKSTDEVSDLLRPFFGSVRLKVAFLTEVLQAPLDEAITVTDLRPLIAPLKVLAKVKASPDPIRDELIQLRDKCREGEGQSQVKLPEFGVLVDAISEVLA
jgi:hypothetical protein